MMIDLPTNIRPRWGRNPRIHVWGASASACDARGSSRDTPDFTSEEFQLQPTARQEVPEIPQTSRLGIPRISIRGIWVPHLDFPSLNRGVPDLIAPWILNEYAIIF
jgi:hypothetical protein